MKILKEKLGFGILQDGLIIRVAQLSLSGGIIYIQSLEETILSSPLFHKEAVEVGEPIPVEEEIDIPEATELKDETFELPEITEFEETEDIGAIEKEEILPGLRDIQNFLQQFPMEKGKISLNANDEQISYFQFDSTFATTKLIKKLQKELLSKEEIKAKNYSLDYILNPDKSGLAFVHRGKLRLFHALRDINLVLSKEKYFYSYIDTNEISLMNLARYNYEFPSDEYVLILYIGVDYKVGIVMKDKNHIKTFPIIVPDTDPENMRQAIYSKITLEQDISNIPITKNVILVGDHTSDEDVDFFKSKFAKGDSVTRLELKNMSIHEGMDNIITPEKIARFAIPIALAWKTLDPKNKDFSPCSLLPVKVIENQKYFKIAWHGFMVLAAIFYFAFSGTIHNLELKQDITDYTKMNYNIERELSQNRELIRRISEIKTKLEKLQLNIQKVERITGKKNQWHYILDILSKSLQRNRLSWINDLTSNNEGFQVYGYTTARRSIIKFSRLFPMGKISSVTKFELQDMNIWKFDITFNYPDSEELKKKKEKAKKVESKVTEEPEIDSTEKKVEEIETKIIERVEEPAVDIAQIYSDIVSIYFAGDINTAYGKFNEFIQKYPSNELAYNSRYFIGECLYIMNRIDEAQEVFEKTYKMHGSKTPDALIMLGNCSEKENDLGKAKSYWNKLMDEFPGTNLAKAAEYKIKKLEGR